MGQINNAHVNVFLRMFKDGMHARYVNACLELPQSEFLLMLLSGASRIKKRDITRSELAKINKISDRNIYSYFSSPGAKDFRPISEDKRIAMLWRTITHLKNPEKPEKTKKREVFYLINGEKHSFHECCKILGYAFPQGLYAALKRRKIANGADITNLKTSLDTRPKSYIVNGVRMGTKEAALALGYATREGLFMRLKKDNVQPGSDISQYTTKRKQQNK